MWRRGPRLRWKEPFAYRREQVVEAMRGQGWSLWRRTVLWTGAPLVVLTLLVSWTAPSVGPNDVLLIACLGFLFGTFLYFIFLAGFFYPRRFVLDRTKLVIRTGTGTSVVRLDRVRSCEAWWSRYGEGEETGLWSLQFLGASRHVLADVPVPLSPGIDAVVDLLRQCSIEFGVDDRAS